MNDDKIENLLIRLLEEMAIVKSKLETLDDLKSDSKNVNVRVDHIEAQNERHENQLKSIAHRCDTVEQFLRNGMQDSKKQMTGIYVSLGLSLFSALLSFILGML